MIVVQSFSIISIPSRAASFFELGLSVLRVVPRILYEENLDGDEVRSSERVVVTPTPVLPVAPTTRMVGMFRRYLIGWVKVLCER